MRLEREVTINSTHLKSAQGFLTHEPSCGLSGPGLSGTWNTTNLIFISLRSPVWGERFLIFIHPQFESRGDFVGCDGATTSPCGDIKRKSDCLISWLKSFKSESSFWNTFQTLLTFSGRLRVALRRDHNLSGFLWWWCRLRRRTQTWRSLCLWRRSCGSRLLWCLGACSGPRTGVWCSYQHPRKY